MTALFQHERQVARGEVGVKDMETGAQETLPAADAITLLSAR